jgi:Fe2+ transport system protein FeoA
MSEKKKSCSGTCSHEPVQPEKHALPAEGEVTLADLPVGSTATILKILPKSRGRKKFADVGLVPGTELLIESHAPFGGLIRVKVMETSMALHKDDAEDIVLKKER